MTVSNFYADTFLADLDDQSVQLLWTDPPFGTGDRQTLLRTGQSFQDGSVGQTVDMMVDMAAEMQSKLTPTGVVAICLDYRAVHQVMVEIDGILNFRGEIIWSYATGGVSKSWWSNKHNTILLFDIDGDGEFNYDQVPTEKRLAPKGDYTHPKKISSVWTKTMSTTDVERSGYPNQKPLAIVEPFIEVHTDPGDLVVDPFCGSGTVAVAAQNLGRRFAVNDLNPDAVKVTKSRLVTEP